MDYPTDSLKQTEQSRDSLTGSASRYLPPRMVLLGKAEKLIRGASSSNYADQTHDFYFYGE